MQKYFKNKYFWIATGVVIVFIFVNFLIPGKYFLKPLRNFFLRITSPISSIFYRGGDSSGSFFSKISGVNRLSDEKVSLEKKVAELTFENTKLKETEHENEILRNELGLKEQLKDSEFIAADIIGRGPSNISSILLINKGSRDGLREGMPVVSSNMLLGKLSEVNSDYSKVILLTDPSSVVNVLVEESRANGILKGEVGFNLRIESVSQDTPLSKGQRIVTSGLGGTLPKGLIVGEVDEVISPKSEIFQSARIKPAVDFNQLELIFVIKN